MLARVRARLRGERPGGQQTETQSLSKKHRRQKYLFHAIYRYSPALRYGTAFWFISSGVVTFFPLLRTVLFIVGYTWMLFLPSPYLSQGIYIDENALQPGQVNTYWSWGDVHSADVYLGHLERLVGENATNVERALYIKSVFSELGIPAATQTYSFETGPETLHGVNAYAVFPAPRMSGTEAIVVAASWSSLTAAPNLRGIATVLSLAAYLKQYSLWAKDIIFVISDGYLDGMHAWLGAYYGVDQSNLHSEPLELHSGVIWTALAIDYPGHSFSHLGVFYEGLNGRLPNQDLMNSFHIISTHTGSVPVVLYDHLEEQVDPLIPRWLPTFLQNTVQIKEYVKCARNVLRHVQYQAFGRASGIHGLFHRYRIDAITLFAVPATGPHGFYALGRIVESTLRTMNNLLERLHASFFFYLLTGPGTFLKIGKYLPSAVIISVAMMFGGLQVWTDAGWAEQRQLSDKKTNDNHTSTSRTPSIWKTRRRNVIPPLIVMLTTHLIGGIVFIVATQYWPLRKLGATTSYFPIIPSSLIIFSIISAFLTPDRPANVGDHLAEAPTSYLLKTFNLCLASTVISITSVLNFSLAATLAVLLGIPLSISSPTKGLILKMVKAMSYFALMSPVWWTLFTQPFPQSIWEWQVLGVWFAPFVCLVYLPLVLQAMVVCMLDP